MAFITWDQTYSVDVAQCDQQHQKLFLLLNGLHSAMAVGQGRKVMGPLLEELAKYTVRHFSTEEALLKKTNYPRLATHRAEHVKFVSQVQRFQQDFTDGKANSSAVMEFLKDWLTAHIRKTDREYSAHLKQHGVA